MRFYEPWQFLSPFAWMKYEPLLESDVYCGQEFPCATFSVILLALPFLWIGLSMSVRRAVDAGLSPRLGFLFAVPGVNYVLMLVLATLPSKPAPPLATSSAPEAPPAVADMLGTILVSSAIAFTMMVIGTALLRNYGSVLFFLTPLTGCRRRLSARV